MLRRSFARTCAALVLLGCGGPAAAQTDPPAFGPVPAGMPRFHDPSTPVKEGDWWWIFSTGNGVAVRRSRDMKSWAESSPVFREFPAWHLEVVPDQKGHLWAPDIVRFKNQWRLYYSVSAFGKNTSAIGLATSKTLNPDSPGHRWSDQGVVVRSDRADDFNAIDPHVFIDPDGRHWMSFGSFWKGIQLMELDPETGLRHPRDGGLRRIAWHESIEAPAILKHGGYYHLFVNWGICCRGVESTYEIRTGRSREITGPYLDKDGRDMAQGGGTLLLGTVGDRIGPGHASFIRMKDEWLMFHHYYDRARRGTPALGWKRLSWTADGWPQVR